GNELRQRLGAKKYAAFVGDQGLRRAIAGLGPWTVPMARPGVFVVRKAQTDSSFGSRAKVIEDGLAKLRADGKERTVMNLGDALRHALGPQTYAKFVGRAGLKRTIEQTGQWSVTEKRPGLFVITTL